MKTKVILSFIFVILITMWAGPLSFYVLMELSFYEGAKLYHYISSINNIDNKTIINADGKMYMHFNSRLYQLENGIVNFVKEIKPCFDICYDNGFFYYDGYDLNPSPTYYWNPTTGEKGTINLNSLQLIYNGKGYLLVFQEGDDGFKHIRKYDLKTSQVQECDLIWDFNSFIRIDDAYFYITHNPYIIKIENIDSFICLDTPHSKWRVNWHDGCWDTNMYLDDYDIKLLLKEITNGKIFLTIINKTKDIDCLAYHELCVCQCGEVKIVSYDIETGSIEEIERLSPGKVPFYYNGEHLMYYANGYIYDNDEIIKSVQRIEMGSENYSDKYLPSLSDYAHQWFFDYIDSDLYYFDLTTF